MNGVNMDCWRRRAGEHIPYSVGDRVRVYACSSGGAVPVTRVLLADNWNAPMRGVSMALSGLARKRTIEVIEPIL